MTTHSIAGVTPKAVFVPGTIAEAASRIAESEAAGEAVAFIGGGTDLEIGSPPERLDLAIHTTKLDRIVEHAPSDQIIAAEAGLTLARLQEVAGAHGQRLAIDPPLPGRATIGGIVAANAFGPLRTRFGSVRDLIIGISIIRADGVLAHGGGKVVKNVAGFDLPKLMAGSLGTLGMIATATFRLHPLPEASQSLLMANRDAAAVRNLVAELRQSQLEAAAVAAIAEGSGFDVCVRFEGFHAGVVAQRDRLTQLHRADGCDVLDAADTTRFWLRHDAVRTGGPLKLKIAALPNAIEMVNASVAAPLLGGLTNGGFVWYPTFGIGFITGTPIDDQLSAAAIESARRVLTTAGGSLTIEAAPAAIRERVSPWGEPRATLPLMQATKQRFDPGRRLAPGRFVGGI
ncbi:MAG TPA: FAD-binding oxidoreductase [Thermoanaerobaculia bacterium]|nr:FAD-binding oxidoreductase [Thermoanaerobaculia bacterium]